MDKFSDNIAIICDFDGTVSVDDVNASVFKEFGDKETSPITRQYINGDIGLREALKKKYETIGIDERTFNKYVNDKMEIDSTFFRLCDFARRKGMKLAIISGGFLNYIKILFEKYGKNMDMPIFANTLVEKNGIMLPRYGETPDCIKSYGPCGICKLKHVMEYKRRYKVVYIGDGYTDRCAAEKADIVFAKNNLSRYCTDNGIKFIPYKNFNDVIDYLKKYNPDSIAC